MESNEDFINVNIVEETNVPYYSNFFEVYYSEICKCVISLICLIMAIGFAIALMIRYQ